MNGQFYILVRAHHGKCSYHLSLYIVTVLLTIFPVLYAFDSNVR